MDLLRSLGINLLSLGVQSFQEKHLEFIGRPYKPSRAVEALEQVLDGNFDSVNIDLMFSIPGQTIKEIIADLDRAMALGVNQITLYPLFTFPYSTVGKYLEIKQVRMPGLLDRRRNYFHISRYLEDKGFTRVSVWGFKRQTQYRYSSVTRDGYLGFGAGAGSHLPDGFYLNTFDVNAYMDRCMDSKLPLALHMPFNPTMQNYFWLYWRFYDTHIPAGELRERFGEKDRKVRQLFRILKTLKLVKENGDDLELTLRGTFWIHLIQNLFVLDYINRTWTESMSKPFPPEIRL